MFSRTTTLFLAGRISGFGGVLSAWAESPTVRPPAGRLEQRGPGTGTAAPVGHRQPPTKDAAPADIPPPEPGPEALDRTRERKLTLLRGGEDGPNPANPRRHAV